MNCAGIDNNHIPHEEAIIFSFDLDSHLTFQNHIHLSPNLVEVPIL